MGPSKKKPSGRVPRNTLSRPLIVETALSLMDDEGLEALTMPRLADRLGVGTMSLYRHIAGKDDLVDSVAAHVLSGVAVPAGAADDWEGRVVGYLRALRTEALRHPALARILAERGLTVAPVLERLDTVHGILRTAGFADVEAVRAFYSLLVFVFGSLLWELPRVHEQPSADYAAAWHRLLDDADPATVPNLVALRDALPTSASEEQFDYGLERLVESLRARAKPKSPLRKRVDAPPPGRRRRSPDMRP